MSRSFRAQSGSHPLAPAPARLHHVVTLIADGKHARLCADVAQVGAVEVVGQPAGGRAGWVGGRAGLEGQISDGRFVAVGWTGGERARLQPATVQ